MMELVNYFNSMFTEFNVWLNTVTGGNQFVAGSILLVISSALYGARKIPKMILNSILRRVMVTYTLTNNSIESYTNADMLDDYITELIKFHNNSWWFRFVRNYQQFNGVKMPSGGTYLIWMGWRTGFYRIHYDFKDREVSSSGVPPRIITIYISKFGFDNGSIETFVENLVKNKKKNRPPVLTDMTRPYTQHKFRDVKRNMDNAYTSPEITKRLIKTVEDFISKRGWYEEKNVKYKESIMLHGEAGTGKTNLIQLLADHFKLDVTVISISRINNNFNDVADYIGKIGRVNLNRTNIIVFEDIDSLTPVLSRDENGLEIAKASKSGDVTLSDILNLFDGITSPENVIYFFTTNHLDKIDSAMLRRGRMNHIIEIPRLTSLEVQKFVDKNFGEEFIMPVGIEYSITIANLQHYFICHYDNFDEFVKELGKYTVNGEGNGK